MDNIKSVTNILSLVGFLAALAAGEISHAATKPPAKGDKPVAKKVSPATKSASAKATSAKPTSKIAAAKPAIPPKAGPKTVFRPTSPKAPAGAPAVRATAADTSANAGVWIKNTAGWTRTLRAASSAISPAYSQTLALAVDGQFLIVPWSYVSDVWLAQGTARFYIDEPRTEVQLVDVDVAANLALLKSDQPLLPSFSRGSVRLDAPQSDEALVVLATREWLRPGARFLRSRVESGVTRYQMALGQAEPNSARFVFDRYGRLVAVAPSMESGEKIWTGTSKEVFDLLRRQDGPKPASIASQEQKHRQLFFWQDKFTNALSPTKNVLSMQALDCQNYLVSVSDKELAAQIRNVRGLQCESRLPLAMGGGYEMGLHLWSTEAALRSSESDGGVRVSKELAAQLFADFEKASSVVNLMTVPECNESTISNQLGQSVRVKFCTSALKIEPGLSDTAVVVSSLDGSKAFVTMARVKGFNQANTRRLLEALIENVRSIR